MSGPEKPLTAGSAFPPKVTARALEDDGWAAPIYVSAWVEHLKCPNTLIDNGSIMEIMSQHVMNKFPNIKVHTDGNIAVTVASDQRKILTKYA